MGGFFVYLFFMSTVLSPIELKLQTARNCLQTIIENKKFIRKFDIEDMKDRGSKRIASELMLKVTNNHSG